jgi:hypothetical protein
MKTTLLSLTIAVILSAILIGVSSDSHAGIKLSESKKSFVAFAHEKELLIQVDESNEKNLPEIRKNIEFFGGMNFKGYCKDLKVLLYVMDTDLHPDYSFLNTAFMNVSLGYVIKEGTILQVQSACGMPAQIDPNQSQN